MAKKMQNEDDRYEGDDDNLDQDISFVGYGISASPNDFNIRTLFDFVDSGIFNIPGFQRNYVWDRKRASKLIESLLIGIPIPQIFLYEQGKNRFMVIDGQQRLLTTYFFVKKRFPKKEKRFELREIFAEHNNKFPDEVLSSNAYFEDFNLSLPEKLPERKNKFNGLNYFTLSEDDRVMLGLKTIRNIVIKQNSPENDDSVVFEIFNRLNTGGVNLKPQEIRTSLYHSKFYDMLYSINMDSNWRKLMSKKTPDTNMKDIEVLLRGFAMLVDHNNYQPSLAKFLNSFSSKAKNYSSNDISYFKQLFEKFATESVDSDEKLFFTEKTNKFNIAVYESIFVALTEAAYRKRTLNIKKVDKNKIQQLKKDNDFIQASKTATAATKQVNIRIKKAKELL